MVHHRCALPKCRESSTSNKEHNLSFHTFPINPAKRQQWVQAVQTANFVPSKHSRICSKHFEASCFVGNRLRKEAFPTIFDFPDVKSIKDQLRYKINLLEENVQNIIDQPVQPSLPLVEPSRLPQEISDKEHAPGRSSDSNDSCNSSQSHVMVDLQCKYKRFRKEIISTMDANTENINFASVFIKEEPLENDTEYLSENEDQKAEDTAILTQNIKTESSLDDGSNNKIQENILHESELIKKDEIKYEFVDEIVKEEPEIVFDKVDIKLEDFSEDSSENSTTSGEHAFAWTSDSKLPKNSNTNSIPQSAAHPPEGPPYACAFCPKTFAKKWRATKHNLTHTNTRKYTCDVCEKQFIRSHHLKAHYSIHTGEKAFKCEACGKAFSRKCALSDHIKTHSEPTFKCDECEASFRKICYLKAHKLTHTNEGFSCEVCGKVFTVINRLKRHLTIHSSVKSFNCNICSKSFRDKSTLKRHILTHSDLKLYQCDMCNKSYSQPGHLTIHKRTHTGQRPYKCSQCGKGFIDKGALTKHEQIHSDVKPFECELCEKRFVRNDLLKLHLKTHYGVKAYECDICHKKFSQSGSLSIHKRSHNVT